MSTMTLIDKGIVSDHLGDLHTAISLTDGFRFDRFWRRGNTFIIFNEKKVGSITEFGYVFSGDSLKINGTIYRYNYLNKLYALLEYINAILVDRVTEKKFTTSSYSADCLRELDRLPNESLNKLWNLVTGMDVKVSVSCIAGLNIRITCHKDNESICIEIGHPSIQRFVQASFKTATTTDKDDRCLPLCSSTETPVAFTSVDMPTTPKGWCEQVLQTLARGDNYDIMIEDILKLMVERTVHIHNITPLRANGDEVISRQRKILLGLVGILETDTPNQDKLKKMTLLMLREMNTTDS